MYILQILDSYKWFKPKNKNFALVHQIAQISHKSII